MAQIKNITADFENNYNGAIYNIGKIGEFDESGNAIGGGISNSSFSSNYVKSESETARGGGLFNSGKTADILTSTFDGNYAISKTGIASGGAIYNSGTIRNIKADFTTNYTKSETGSSLGGAIYNQGTIGDITGDFKENYAKSTSSYARGGAIYNTGEIGNINGSFINNSISGVGETFGGAIWNTKTIKNINGDFIGNKVTSTATLRGGAIYNTGRIESITGSFIDNQGTNTGKYYAMGGAIINFTSAYIGNIKGDFKRNSLTSTINCSQGGAIANLGSSIIENITGNFIKNSVKSTESFANGGALFGNWDITTIKNSSFIGNYAEGKTDAHGGAIYTSTGLNITADGAVSTFKDNYTQVGDVKDDNAIYLSNGSTLNFETLNNGKIEMFDNIRGASKEVAVTDEDGNAVLDEEGNAVTRTQNYTVNITGDGSGTFGMYNQIYDADLLVGNTNLNTINNQPLTYSVNKFTLTGDTNMMVDVDLANSQMDRITANEYGEHNGNLNVVGMNMLSDSNKDVTNILFADKGLKDNVTYGGTELPHNNFQTTAYTPIFKYNVAYSNKDDGGYFLFTKGNIIIEPTPTEPEKPAPGGNTGNASDAFNPAVLSAPVANVAASQATVTETFKYVFGHADAFTQLPSMDRLTMIKQNQYALSTDYNKNLDYSTNEFSNKAGWFRPYVSFEKMNLKNGPSVNATTYGSLFGFDSDFQKLKHGWTGVTTGYIGYNGSNLHYSGVDTTMNGGLLGVTQTFYKGNFWTALTATAGASVGQSRTMYGKEDFTSLMAGIGSKTGYNFEFKEGRYIVQPIMFMSYTFVNTFDYTNAAGVRINSDPAHSIQLNPSVRFITNTKNGWQPYASVGMVWNVMNENKVMANNIALPESSMKPYVEYGVGLQKRWKDKFTAFGQAMIRNGGRNGIALTAGFRWTLGKDDKSIEKVNAPSQDGKQISSASVSVNETRLGENGIETVETANNPRQGKDGVRIPQTTKTILKQLSPQQKQALMAKNSTRTIAKGVMKQL